MEQSLQYQAPKSLEQALSYLEANPAAKVLAGGTDFMLEYKGQLLDLKKIVDLGRIRELKGIVKRGHEITIGAMTTHSEIIKSPAINRYVSVLRQACLEVGGPQIQNRGTIGGNLVNASPASDTAPPLIVLDSKVNLVRGRVQRAIPLKDFFLGPGDTALNTGELLTRIAFPEPDQNTSIIYLKLGQRKALSIAVCSLALSLLLSHDKKKILKVKICLGSVGPTPIIASKTAQTLTGNIKDLSFEEAEAALRSEISPIDDLRASKEYRQAAAVGLLRKALSQLLMRRGAV